MPRVGIRYQVFSLDEMLQPGEDTAPLQKCVGAQDPRLSGTVERTDLEHALEQLPRGYKEIFILHDVQGHEHIEIAVIRGCSVGNSKSQLHKARTRLRQLLQAGVHHQEHRITESLDPMLSAAQTA